jgi:hypothetical protein
MTGHTDRIQEVLVMFVLLMNCGPVLRLTTKKLSFLVCGPFSSKLLCGNLSPIAVHELSLPRKAFKGIQEKGQEKTALSHLMGCLDRKGRPLLRQKKQEVEFLGLRTILQ